MPKTHSPATDSLSALLLVAAQDLHAGARLLATALPRLARSVEDQALATLLKEAAAQSEIQATRLSATGLAMDGPPNLWMKGIVSDARRDSRTIMPGPLLDLALIGAVRKSLAAEIVSYETLIVLARSMANADMSDVAARNLAERRAADRQMSALLERVGAAMAS